jgi:CHAT domain-containing protein
MSRNNLYKNPPFLVYLSAYGRLDQNKDNKSIDESIYLTSAFQLAGFRHVIGTLWHVDDEICVDRQGSHTGDCQWENGR